ncbi:hypothetical protein ACLK2E_02310 [Escherichia coli]
MAAGDNRQRPVAAQFAGQLVLLLVVVADGAGATAAVFAARLPAWLVTSSRGRRNGTGQKIAPGVPSRSGRIKGRGRHWPPPSYSGRRECLATG